MNWLRRNKSKILIALRWVLLAAVVGFAVYYLAAQWKSVSHALTLIAWPSLVLSFLLVLFGLAAGTMSWISVLNGLGPRVPVARGAQVMLVGALGKYVPGSVWSYVMQMELGRQHGILRPRVLIASLYAAGIGVVASLVLGSFALPVLIEGHVGLLWLYLLLPIGLCCLHPKVMTWLSSLVLRIFRRPPLDHTINVSVVAKALGWAIVSYTCYGAHLWVLSNSLKNPSFISLVLMTGAIALGFTVGIIAFVLPSGVGVRDAVLIASMTIVLTQAEATAVTLVSRLMFTAADLLAAGIAVSVALIARRRLYLADETQFEADAAAGIDLERT